MSVLHFPKPYSHDHVQIKDLNEIIAEKKTIGQKASDSIAKIMGSWNFLIIQSVLLAFWVALNIVAYIKHWDPYPFILLNLFLSLQAAYTAPVIMMSQNRQAERDRLDAHYDFLINQKAEEEIRVMMEHLSAQDKALEEIHELISDLKTNN